MEDDTDLAATMERAIADTPRVRAVLGKIADK